VDFLGRYENIKEDFRVVGQKLGINSALPNSNKSETGVKINLELIYQQKEAVDVIRQIYREDIKSFGYVFEKSKYIAQ
jgi:hypothetical protein